LIQFIYKKSYLIKEYKSKNSKKKKIYLIFYIKNKLIIFIIIYIKFINLKYILIFSSTKINIWNINWHLLSVYFY